MDYNEFLHSKVQVAPVSGFTVRPEDVSPALKPHQRDAVIWAIKGGRRALFESFGLGKTVQELDGCEFCSDAKWISGQVMASHSHNDGIICNQIDGDFDFCPMCGRKLPEPPKEV